MKHMAGNIISRWTEFLTTDGEKPNRHRDEEFIDRFTSRKDVMEYWERGWAVLFKTMYVSSASNGRLLADFVSLTGAVKYTEAGQRQRWIIRFSCMLPVIGLVMYLSLGDPKLMVIIGGFFQAATLPVISGATIYLRYFRTDRRLAPSVWSDILLWFAFLTITAVSLYAIPQWGMNTLWPAIKSWTGQ
jgi:hypothetical protein